MGRQATRDISRFSRWLKLALAGCLLASLTALPAHASVGPQDDTNDGGPASWAPEPAGRIEVASAPGVRSLWTWMAGNRGYALSGMTDYTSLDAYDLDTYASVGSTDLDPPAYISALQGYGDGAPHTLAVDEAGGRLFVAYTAPSDSGGVTTVATDASTYAATTVAGQVACPRVIFAVHCVGGIHVLDATTLEPVRSPVPLRNIRPETNGFSPWIRAMAYAPPRAGTQENGKVLMVLEDLLTAGFTSLGDARPRLKGFNPVYAVQLDPVTGVQDWAVRIDPCRGARETESSQDAHNDDFEHPSAIFRSASVTDPAVFVACHNGTAQTAVVVKLPLDAAGNASFLPVRAGAGPTTAAPETLDYGQAPPQAPQPQAYAPQSTSPRTAVGPTTVFRQIADPIRERILMQSLFGGAEVWWVFDTAQFAFIGTIGIGPIGDNAGTGGRPAFDPVSGRLYVQGAARTSAPAGTVSGLFITDTAADPLPQALVFTDGWPTGTFLAVIPPHEDGPPRLLSFDTSNGAWQVFQDRVPFGAASGTGDPADGGDANAGATGLTLDLDEVEGVTQASFDGTARGYGARAVLVGGLEAAGRVDRFDPGWWYQLWSFTEGGAIGSRLNPLLRMLDSTAGVNPKHPCSQSNRELVLAFVGPEGDAVVDGSGSRGSAQPVRYDSGTQADTELPVSRCGFLEWAQYWNVGLFGRPPVEEPGLPTQGLKSDTAQCISSDADPSSSVGDAVGDGRAAKAECAQEEASGFGYVRGVTVTDNAVGEALSSFRVYRDPGRGIVSRVESVARGIDIGGLVRIDTVRGSAESWANGRRQPVDAAQRDPGYVPNCDVERSAGTCFKRQLFGVRTPAYSCGPCGNENQAVDAMSRALGSNGRVQLREPDPALAPGSEDGYQAAILKPASERFTDAAIHNDFLTTVVPTLEIVRYASPSPPASKESINPALPGPRGLQVYQFAGVAVSSSYSIQCLLIYDAATNTCAGEKLQPGAIQVSLSDSDGKPLAGGAFEIRADVDADGVLGLKDTLLPDGACVTAADGVGTCNLENLQPGSYLVSQVAAPPGYAKSAEPFVVELASGEQRTVAFTNVSNVSTIELKATDEAGSPLSGAVFAAYPDPDSDGKVAPEAKPAAECTTDAQGACQMRVPAGSYVLVQTAAPGGLEGIEPVAFTFASGGQVASVSVVNYPPGVPQAPEGAAAPIAYTPPVDMAPPTEIVDDGYIAPSAPVDVVQEPEVSLPDRIGGTVTQVIRAPGDALRLLARDPKQAVAWTAALALFVLAGMAVRRRQHAMALIDG